MAIDASTVILALLSSLPFLLGVLLLWRANGRWDERHLQVFLPIVAIVASVVCALLTPLLHGAANAVYDWAAGGAREDLPALACLLSSVYNLLFLALLAAIKLAYRALARRYRTEMEDLLRDYLGVAYERDRTTGTWRLRRSFRGARELVGPLFLAVTIISACLFVVGSLWQPALVEEGFAPCFLVAVVGEAYHYINDVPPHEREGEPGTGAVVAGFSYARIADALRSAFRKRLLADSHRSRAGNQQQGSSELIRRLVQSDDERERVAGEYFNAVASKGLMPKGEALRTDWMAEAVGLLKGTSVLFANPFYRDLEPYLFLPVNAQLMRGRKVLFVYGSQNTEESLRGFVEDGLAFVTNIPSLWEVGRLARDGSATPDVGLVAYSDLCDMELLHANAPYFRSTTFVVLADTSSLLATFQIGLGMLARLLSKGDAVTYCALDRNCDGLVDSLSHALRTRLTEVGATEAGSSEALGLFWNADGGGLSRDILPGVTRYLGMGAELGLVALKNHADMVTWAARSAVPLADVRWILGQYYGEMTDYAGLPREQRQIDEHFEFASDLWSLQKREKRLVVAEDESNNMFETFRQFATRGNDDVLVNVLAPDYLLRDYMAANGDLFIADPKAVPSLAPDYSRSARNAAFGLAMAMLRGDWEIGEDEVAEQLAYAGVPGQNAYDTLARLFVTYLDSDDSYAETPESHIQVTERYEFDPRVQDMVGRRYFSLSSEAQFAESFALLRSVPILSETAEGDEGERLGSRLYGLVWQSVLPGQYLTLDGRYYEVLDVSDRFGVVLRRAADHFGGRRYYRQLRRYRLEPGEDVGQSVRSRTFGDIEARLVPARVSVDTYGYLDMGDRADVRHATRVEVEGVPPRTYRNKDVLRVELGGADAGTTATVAVVMSELFVTLFPHDHQYLSVVTPAAEGLPEGILDELVLPEDLSTDDEDEGVASSETATRPGRNVIYVVEDAIVDMGLLTAIDRSLRRILEICWDYLDWALHKDGRRLPEVTIPPELLDDGEEATEPEGEVSQEDASASGTEGPASEGEGSGESESETEPAAELGAEPAAEPVPAAEAADASQPSDGTASGVVDGGESSAILDETGSDGDPDSGAYNDIGDFDGGNGGRGPYDG